MVQARKNGRTSVDRHSGGLSTTTTPDKKERARLEDEKDRRLTIRKVENYLGLPNTSVWIILTRNLQVTLGCAKFNSNLIMAEEPSLRNHSGILRSGHY